VWTVTKSQFFQPALTVQVSIFVIRMGIT